MDKKFGTFRKATFGGFNRKDVISYIEKIKNETFEYRCQVEETIKKLNEKIIELESALVSDGTDAVSSVSARGEHSFAVGEGYTDIKDATEHLKSVADELCSSLGDFIEKLSQRGLCDNGTTAELPISEVESILSSMDFLADTKEESETDVEIEESSTEIEDILTSLSFLY